MAIFTIKIGNNPPIELSFDLEHKPDNAAILSAIQTLQGKVMSALDDLEAAVAAETTVIDSAIQLLNGLKAALDAAGTDPVKLSALAADIQAKTAALSAAVVANTPMGGT